MAEICFNSTAGRIEGVYHESKIKNAPVALVLHPNTAYGGTMNNKVVYSVYKTFVQNGFNVLRMNFRGAGKSQGKFDNGVGELVDAATAFDWLQMHNDKSSSLWVAGFSFGSWIGMQLIMRRPEVKEFIAISPPVNKYDFAFLSPCPIPGLVVQGTNDSVVKESEVVDFVDFLSQQKCVDIKYHSVHGADHFFRDKITDLSDLVDEYIKNNVTKYNTSFPFVKNYTNFKKQ